MHRADNLTTSMCRLSRNSGASASWNPKGLSRPVAGKLYLFKLISLLKSSGQVYCKYRQPTTYLFFVCLSEQTASFALYSIQGFVFITEMESVYCAVRSGSLNIADYVSSVNGCNE